MPIFLTMVAVAVLATLILFGAWRYMDRRIQQVFGDYTCEELAQRLAQAEAEQQDLKNRIESLEAIATSEKN